MFYRAFHGLRLASACLEHGRRPFHRPLVLTLRCVAVVATSRSSINPLLVFDMSA